MRIAIASLLFLSATWFASAQPPTTPPGSDKLVIRPGGKGVETAKSDPGRPGDSGSSGPDEKAGFIVIRPGGKGILGMTTQVVVPKQPTPVSPASQPASGSLPVPPPGAQPKETADGKPIFDYWFAVGVDGHQMGYVNWAAKELEEKGKSFAVGVRYLNLTISRFGQVVTQWGEESTVESPTGNVYITGMRQGLGKDQALALSGRVEGKTLKMKGDGLAAGASDTPWPEGVVGLVREPKLFKELKLKQGESFEYPSYIPTVNRVLKTTLTFDGEETKVLWANTPARKLLKFTTRPEPIGKVKLPVSITWVDSETFEPLQLQTDFPALGGQLTFLRTTKEAATLAVTKPVELFNIQSIRLDRAIPEIHTRGSVVYKVSIQREDEPETVFASNARQQVQNLDAKAKTFELQVSGSRGPDKNAPAQAAPGKEFTASNYFINWDNDLVKAHTAKAVAGLPAAATGWDKAVAIERWVKANMNSKAFDFSQAMTTADIVAKTLSGDCRQYSMLTAAMCRAAGVPSRTALGVVYALGRDGKPFLAYHMWTEVFAEGQWLSLDATLGMGGIGPGHVKITDHSWYEEKSFAPLLPVLRALTAKPAFDVLKVTP
jgi:hypothetical protein